MVRKCLMMIPKPFQSGNSIQKKVERFSTSLGEKPSQSLRASSPKRRAKPKPASHSGGGVIVDDGEGTPASRNRRTQNMLAHFDFA